MTALDKSRSVGSGICKIIVLSAYTGGKNVPFDVIVQYPDSKVVLAVRVHPLILQRRNTSTTGLRQPAQKKIQKGYKHITLGIYSHRPSY